MVISHVGHHLIVGDATPSGTRSLKEFQWVLHDISRSMKPEHSMIKLERSHSQTLTRFGPPNVSLQPSFESSRDSSAASDTQPSAGPNTGLRA